MRLATTLTCAVLTALGLGPLTTTSFAGTYTSTDCASWDTYSAAQYDQTHAMVTIYQACGNGGLGLGMSVPSAGWTGPQTGATWSVKTPAGTHFSSVWMYQRGSSDPGAGWELEVYAAGPGGWTPLGAWKDGASVWRGISSPAGNYTLVTSHLTCVSGSGCTGSLRAGLFIRDLILNMVDDAPPTVSASGELLNGDVQRGTDGLGVSAQDIGAGLTQVYAVVNDQVVAAQNLACAGPSMQPCPLAKAQPLHFDLDTQHTPFHDGGNTVLACAADYGAPPNVTCTGKELVMVDNSCAPSSVPGGSHLSAAFSQSHRRIVHVKAGHGARLTGRLTDNSGEPVAGATLCMKEGIAGAALASVGTVTTNANGRYRFRVAPGPNRKLKVGYRYNRKQVDRRARFKSRLRPRLKVSPKSRTENGKQLRLYGSIPGPRNRGRIVVLQASAIHSKSWLTFRKARTDRHGNYTARYRFTSTNTTTKYRFRALVPPQNGYPYEGGTSLAKEITVIGR
jgi:hypothetical protein